MSGISSQQWISTIRQQQSHKLRSTILRRFMKWPDNMRKYIILYQSITIYSRLYSTNYSRIVIAKDLTEVLPDTTISALTNIRAVSQQEFRDLQMTLGARFMKWCVPRVVFRTRRAVELLQTISSHVLRRNTSRLDRNSRESLVNSAA